MLVKQVIERNSHYCQDRCIKKNTIHEALNTIVPTHPWSFHSASMLRELLKAIGFQIQVVQITHRPHSTLQGLMPLEVVHQWKAT